LPFGWHTAVIRNTHHWRNEMKTTMSSTSLLVSASAVFFVAAQIGMASFTVAVDPGVRPSGPVPSAGGAIAGISANQLEYFGAGQADFAEAESVAEGLGPRMNLDSCAGCHSQPATGGSSPAVNPQIAFATLHGGTDSIPSFLSASGPVREARFVSNADGTPDGGVHALFTITGRLGADGCSIAQPDFARQVANHNVIFRIPTPVFGAGLVEAIPDSVILANQAANSATKASLGIGGRANFAVSGRTISGQTNNNGNDGTIARFGWKAQNKSLMLFSGEAYNVEMGITNELFPTEREEKASCQKAGVPNDITDADAITPVNAMSGVELFSHFMRMLAPPTPSPNTPGNATLIAAGRAIFRTVGCEFCHTASFTTGNAAIAALAHQPVNLFSDLLVHDMGVGLADGVSQGEAGPREFRSAPLWGLGQRVFFLHDGRTSNLITAIRAHASSGSEANGVVANYLQLTETQKQNLLYFLRSL
jgi:CxxC motif-containing protein (DUF1111 family)